MTLRLYIQDKKYIFWYVKDVSELSDEAIIEWVIKYWTWEDLKKIITIEKQNFKKIFKQIISKPRCNLNKKEINFISKLIQDV